MRNNVKLNEMTDLLQELRPEELQSRLELQVLVDPMRSMSSQNANNNRANNNRANNN
jgi:hypothetical protein